MGCLDRDAQKESKCIRPGSVIISVKMSVPFQFSSRLFSIELPLTHSPPYKSRKYLMSKFEGVDTDESDVGEPTTLDAARKRRVKSAASRSRQKRSKVTAAKPFKMTLR